MQFTYYDVTELSSEPRHLIKLLLSDLLLSGAHRHERLRLGQALGVPREPTRDEFNRKRSTLAVLFTFDGGVELIDPVGWWLCASHVLPVKIRCHRRGLRFIPLFLD
jgi:hypothetical protein